MMIIASYRVTTYIGLDEKRDDEIRELGKNMGGKSIGSGSGFFKRDLEFEFTNPEKAEDFMRECKILGLEATTID